MHAERARGGGKAGELLLAARYLEHAGHEIPLRGMQLGGAGNSRTNESLAVAIATGPIGMLVRGGNLEIPAGTLAVAKLARALDPTMPPPPLRDDDVPEQLPPPSPGDDTATEFPEPAIQAAPEPATRQE